MNKEPEIFVTSDIHFFHKNIIGYCPLSRGRFQSVPAMNSAIVDNINSVTSPNDILYILGDVSFGTVQETNAILNSIHCKKILIIGNHDRSYISKKEFTDCFESIHEYLEIKYDNMDIIMFHYPISEYNKQHRGAIHLFGHLHDKPHKLSGRVKNIGMDVNNCFPFNLKDVVEELKKIKDFTPH